MVASLAMEFSMDHKPSHRYRTVEQYSYPRLSLELWIRLQGQDLA